MKKYQLIGGILMLAGAAAVFLFLESDAKVPVTGAMALAGIALVAASRKRSQTINQLIQYESDKEALAVSLATAQLVAWTVFPLNPAHDKLEAVHCKSRVQLFNSLAVGIPERYIAVSDYGNLSGS